MVLFYSWFTLFGGRKLKAPALKTGISIKVVCYSSPVAKERLRIHIIDVDSFLVNAKKKFLFRPDVTKIEAGDSQPPTKVIIHAYVKVIDRSWKSGLRALAWPGPDIVYFPVLRIRIRMEPELLFRIQQKMKEQINKIKNSHFRPVNSGLCVL